MSKVYKIKLENGYYVFKLEQVLADKHISKNKLIQDTNTDFKVIQRMGRGDCIRIDLFVLARLCDYLKCDISDIIEYKKD